MQITVQSGAVSAVSAIPIRVVVTIESGLPRTQLTGMSEYAARETVARVAMAITSEGIEYPRQRVLIDLRPCHTSMRVGMDLDLSITVGILAASGAVPAERLAGVAPGAAWVALALAALLSLDRLFERDYEDGALDLLALGPLPLEAVFAVKALAQWLAIGLPLALPPAPADLVVAMARVARARLVAGAALPPPAPLYIRSADAAPPRDPAPVILP